MKVKVTSETQTVLSLITLFLTIFYITFSANKNHKSVIHFIIKTIVIDVILEQR